MGEGFKGCNRELLAREKDKILGRDEDMEVHMKEKLSQEEEINDRRAKEVI